MRSILLLVLSAILGVGVAAIAARFGPGRVQKTQIVDTREKGRKASTIADVSHNALQPNVANLPAPGVSPGQTAPEIRVRGYVVRGGRVNVLLSDGRLLTERDDIEDLTRNGVFYEGKKLYMVTPRERALSPQISTPAHEVPAAAPSAPPIAQTSTDSVASWRTDADGVQRLTQKEELGKSSFTLR